MKLTYRPYTLTLRDRFTLSSSSRTTTPVVLVEIESEGAVGYGEASLPPYLTETGESVVRFLSKADLRPFSPARHSLDQLLDYVQNIEPENSAAKAALDIALHDLYGKLDGKPCHQQWKADLTKIPPTSFTIGIASPDEIRRKTIAAAPFKILKVKLGCQTDRLLIETIRSVTDTPLCVDVNQGWSDKYQALDMLQWCKEQGVVFAEQPMPKEQKEDLAWLSAHSPVPVIADEGFQRLSDLDEVKNIYSGINIKLMKCAGMREARQCIDRARETKMKVMLGCMTETSCAISAAAQLSPWVDWADLDGNLLISNDCFEGARLIDGRMFPTASPGIGAVPLAND